MHFTAFGLFWLTTLMISFIRNNAKIMLFLLMLGMVFQSASVLVLNGYGVGSQVVTSIVFLLWIIFYSNTMSRKKFILKKWSKIRKVSTFCLILTAIWIVVINDMYSVSLKIKNVELYILMLIIYMTCLLAIWTVYKRFTVEDINKIMLWVIWFVAFMGVLQFMITVNVLPHNVIIEMFVYTRDTDSAYYWSSFYPRVFSVFMEPSYCAAFMVGAFYYLISREQLTRSSSILAVVLVLEIILTFSSTAYGSFFLTGIVYLLLSKNKEALKFLLPLGAIMLVLMGLTGTLQNVLDDVIFNKMSTGSAWTRKGWDENAVEMFLRNPITGGGYKSVRGSHLYTSIIGQLGIVGTAFYIMAIVPLLLGSLRNRGANASAFFLIGVIIAQLIALPDLDFCVFWQGMYFVVLMLSVTRCQRGAETCEERMNERI